MSGARGGVEGNSNKFFNYDMEDSWYVRKTIALTQSSYIQQETDGDAFEKEGERQRSSFWYDMIVKRTAGRRRFNLTYSNNYARSFSCRICIEA